MLRPLLTSNTVDNDVSMTFSEPQRSTPFMQPSPMYPQRGVVRISRTMRRPRDEYGKTLIPQIDDSEVDLRKEYSSRFIYSHPGRAKRPRLQPTLFEILPVDVCSRIAAYVSCGKPTQEALHFGETSPHLRNAVVSTLSYKYVCVNSWYYSQDVVKRWAVLFGDDLQDLSILQPRCGDKDAYEFMLNSSSLRTVELQDTTYAMHQHLVSREIRNLSILLTGVLPSQLFSFISSPCIRNLTLSCTNSQYGVSRSMHCKIDMVCQWGGARLIKAAFPNLRAVQIRCRCNCNKALLWELMRCLPALEEIRIGDLYIPRNMLSQVRKLKSVQVESLSGGLVIAHAVGAPLTSLRTLDVVEEEDLECPKIWSALTSITIALGKGAEQAFLAAAPLFSETLRTLRLSPSAYNDHNTKSRLRASVPPKEPKAGIWLEIVKKLPHVQTLSFENIRMNLGELIAIVKHVGERLQFLDVTLDMQQEHSLVRLERVMLVASIHCPSLRGLNVELGEFRAPDIATELLFPYKVRWMARMGRGLGRVLELLKRRSPFFDDESLKLFVTKLVNL